MIPLRPLGIGEIISGVFGTLRRYAKAIYLPLAGVAVGTLAVLGAWAVVAVLVLGGLYRDARNHPGFHPTSSQFGMLVSVAGASAVLLLLCLTAMSVVATVTSTAVIGHAVLGRPVTASQVWARSRPHLWRVLASQLLAGVGCLGIIVVSFLPALVIALAGGGGAATGLALLCVVPGWLGAAYVQVRLVLQIPALMLEELRPIAATRRAWKLNEGAWWRSFGIPYLVNLIGSFAGQFIGIPFTFLGMLMLFASSGSAQAGSDNPGRVPDVTGIIAFVVCVGMGAALSAVLALPLTPLTNGLLYIDRRIRRESLDITLASAAGLQPRRPMPSPGTPSIPSPQSPSDPVAEPVDSAPGDEPGGPADEA